MSRPLFCEAAEVAGIRAIPALLRGRHSNWSPTPPPPPPRCLPFLTTNTSIPKSMSYSYQSGMCANISHLHTVFVFIVNLREQPNTLCPTPPPRMSPVNICERCPLSFAPLLICERWPLPPLCMLTVNCERCSSPSPPHVCPPVNL